VPTDECYDRAEERQQREHSNLESPVVGDRNLLLRARDQTHQRQNMTGYAVGEICHELPEKEQTRDSKYDPCSNDVIANA